MGVPETAESGAVADMRAVRVALLVGVRVVLAMVGDPIHDRTLNRERTEHRQAVLDPGVGLEGTVRQQPMEAKRHAGGAQHVHHDHDPDVSPVDHRVPQQDDRGDHPKEGNHHPGEVGVALQPAHAGRWAFGQGARLSSGHSSSLTCQARNFL